MTQEQAQLHFKQHLEHKENGTEPVMQLHEWREYYEKQEENQKWRRAAEARKRKSQRKGIKPKVNDDKKKKKVDDPYKHRILAVKRLSEQGYTRNQICEIAHLPYDFVDTIIRGLDLDI